MNSSCECASPLLCMNCCVGKKVNDMSPVTDLAFNMKGLKTTSVGTPTRRISWSDPFPNGGALKCVNDSPSTDSPMLQEILMKNVNRIKSAAPRKMLPLNYEDEKENVHPDVNNETENKLSRRQDSMMESDSQDSGYCSISSTQTSTVESTPRIRVKSSLFTNNIQDLDGLFPMEEDIDMEPASESDLNSLLTKPLCNVQNTCEPTRKGKLPIRRCLTMEMESTGDSSSLKSELFSQADVSFQSETENKSVISEPLRRLSFKRTDRSAIFSWQSKRRKSSPSVNISSDISAFATFIKQRSFSETAATIMQAVQKADLQPDLIGDCSRTYALPLVKGRHQDLKCISAETLLQLIKGEFREIIDTFILIDCRYPYEYEGGHIQGAENIYTKEEIMQTFLEKVPEPTVRNVIIFHCEFSSERAPNLCRFLRNKDRELNESKYPKLYHPEIYLLDGGYKAFFANYREYCIPQDYKPMNHKDHSSDLRLFRAKSKSWGVDNKSRYKLKSNSEIMDI